MATLAGMSAFAQSSVTLSGRASMEVNTFEASADSNGANAIARRARVTDTASRITFAANEDLGGGMKAGVYCETGINIDNAGWNGGADTPNANTSSWCSREGRAYVGNATGEIRLGRQNVWWTQGALNEVGSTYMGTDTLTNLQNGGVGVYTVRGENMVKLSAGAGLGGFAGSELYWGYMGTSGFDSTSATVTGESAAQPSGKYKGFKLLYTQGAFVGMWDYQDSHNSAFVTPSQVQMVGFAGAAAADATKNYNRKSNKYGVGYKYTPDSMVSLQLWNKERTENVANANTAKDGGWGLVVKHDLGGGLLAHLQYGKARKTTYSDNTVETANGATAYTLGLTKAMSKRTHFYTAYHHINNDTAGTYNMSGGNYSVATRLTGGQDIKAMSLGMIHNF